MGFSGDLLHWMVSYLKDRKQFAEANGCNVPQKLSQLLAEFHGDLC